MENNNTSQENSQTENSPRQKTITKPNYTQVPNIVLDYWITHLTPAEFKVLMCLCRETFGWHEKKWTTSLRYIEEKTKLSRFGITKNLKKLEEVGLIKKIKSKTSDGDDAPNQYEVYVNSVGGGSQLSLLGVVNSVADSCKKGVVNSVDPTKKEYICTKENKNIARTPASQSSKQQPDDFFFSHQSKKFEGITEQDLADWEICYPSINIKQEILRSIEWLKGNPSKANKKLWRLFLTGWFSRANEKAENKAAYQETRKNSSNSRQGSKLNFEKETNSSDDGWEGRKSVC